MRPLRSFDAFLAGVALFLAGVFFANVMASPGWNRYDSQFAIYTLAGVAYGVWRLHALYRNQGAPQHRDPLPNDR
jgi:hypothetical protein